MKFFSRSSHVNRPPTETLQISDTSLCIAIWSVESASGRHRIHFKISRNAPDGGSFVLMQVADLLDYPRAIAVLARGIRKAPSLAHLRQKLDVLERLMMNADARLRANSDLNELPEADENALA